VPFVTAQDGPTATEYLIMPALIVVARITALATPGTGARGTFPSVAAVLTAGR
jgi:Flp pilus assembly pilin Flp